MKACAYCGQPVKDRVTVCPVCKRPIKGPDAEVFPELRAPRRKKTADAEEEARRSMEEAERKAQQALAPDDPEAELLSIERRGYEEARSKKTMAAAAYTGLLFFVPWYACKDKRYGVFHANQGLVVLLFLIVGVLLDLWIGATAVGSTVSAAYFGGLFYLMVLGMVRGLRGKMIPLPIIGGITLIRYKGSEKAK